MAKRKEIKFQDRHGDLRGRQNGMEFWIRKDELQTKGGKQRYFVTVYVDKPPEVVKSLYTAEVTKKVPQFIPWVRVYEVTWSYGEQGHIKPKVVITRA